MDAEMFALEEFEEILWLEKANRCRECPKHSPCGSVVQQGSLIRIRLAYIYCGDDEKGNGTKALACYWVVDGVERCCVGFVSKSNFRSAHFQHSDLSYLPRKSKLKGTVALAEILDDGIGATDKTAQWTDNSKAQFDS